MKLIDKRQKDISLKKYIFMFFISNNKLAFKFYFISRWNQNLCWANVFFIENSLFITFNMYFILL